MHRVKTLLPAYGTPMPIAEMAEKFPEALRSSRRSAQSWRIITAIYRIRRFTVEEGKLYMPQTRNGKRTCHMALKIAQTAEYDDRQGKQAVAMIDLRNLIPSAAFRR